MTTGEWVNFSLCNFWKRIGKTPWVRIFSPFVLIKQIEHFAVNSSNVIFCRRIYIFARLFQHVQRIGVPWDIEKSTDFAWSRLELYAVLVLSGNRRIQFFSGVFNNQWNQSHFVELRLSSSKSWTLDVCSLVDRLWFKPIPGQWIQKITIWNHWNGVWHFCKAVVTRKLERVEERALHVVLNNTAVAYEELLKWANIPCLENRRSSKLIVYWWASVLGLFAS